MKHGTSMKSFSINDPTEMILFGDGYNHHTNDGSPTAGFYSEAINGTSRLGGLTDFIHSKKKNLVFADGHVESKTRSFCAGNSEHWDPSLQ